MQKKLSIMITATDAATSVTKAVANSLLSLGKSALGAGSAVAGGLTGALGGLWNKLTSIKSLIAGGAIFAGLYMGVSAFNATADVMDKIGKKAEDLGLLPQTVSVYSYAAKLANIETDGFLAGISALTKSTAEFASTGGGKAAPAFERLGISVRDSNGQLKGMEDLLPEIADKLSGVTNATQRWGYASALFGKGNAAMVRFLAEGKEALRGYAEEARRLGVVFTERDVRIAAEYTDSLTRLSFAWLGVKASIVREAGPALTDFFNTLSGYVAAAPKILANGLNVIRDGLFGSGKGREIVAEVFQDLKALIIEGIAGLALVTVVALVESSKAVVRTWGSSLTQSLREEFLVQWASLYRFIGKTIIDNGGGTQLATSMGAPFLQASYAMEQALDVMQKMQKMAPDAQVRAIMTDTSAITNAWNSAWASIAASGAKLGISLDKLTQWKAEFAKVDVTPFLAVGAQAKRVSDEVGESWMFDWDEFRTGWSGALDQWTQKAYDALSLGKQMGTEFVTLITDSLGSAMFKVAQNWRDAGKALKGVLQSLLESISQILFKMIAMRLVAAALIGFGFGGGEAAATGGGWEGGGGAAYAYHGGMVSRAGISRYELGGFVVPGPNVGRDMVHAMLAPGELVVGRQAVKANDPGDLAYLARGGRVVRKADRGDAGGDIHVHISLAGMQVPASAASDPEGFGRMLGKGIAAAVVTDLAARPSQRAALKRVLGMN